MNGNSMFSTWVVMAISGLLSIPLAAGAESPAATGKVFPLEEVSILNSAEPGKIRLQSGQPAECGRTPSDGVTYPAFKSSKPIYGTVVFDTSLLDPRAGLRYHFAIDETAGAGYDRLYFDVNHDSDLTNDAPVGLAKNLPAGTPDMPGGVLFENVRVNLDYGPGQGVFPQTIMPRLMEYMTNSGQNAYMSFTALTARRGKIQLGAQEMELVLGQIYAIAGRYDRPMTGAFLGDTSEMLPFLGAWRLVNGTFYRLAATPAGDKVTVMPYTGPFGVLQTGAGARNMAAPTIDSGYMCSKDALIDVSDCLQKDGKLSLPVGDYRPLSMTVRYGQRRIGLTIDRSQAGRKDAPAVFPVTIRQDKPFVLDFPGKPEVVFASPAAGARLKLGQELKAEATLCDVGAGVMISILEDTTRKRDSIKLPNGRTLDMFESVSPTIKIANSAGQTIAEGVMPFGWGGTCGYSWRVPDDLKLSGNEEKFTITVTFDTQELYGTISGKREITITRN